MKTCVRVHQKLYVGDNPQKQNGTLGPVLIANGFLGLAIFDAFRSKGVDVGPSLHHPPLARSGTSQLDPLKVKSWGSGRDSAYFSIAN